jgi:hypothetical protein
MKDARYWNRLWSKNTERFIECTYWACPQHTIVFAEESGRAINDHYCTAKKVCLTFWEGTNAPSFCPRRLTPSSQNSTLPKKL